MLRIFKRRPKVYFKPGDFFFEKEDEVYKPLDTFEALRMIREVSKFKIIK
jgi:hypothetical protein